ncbi:MAG TPA: hypothetical protein VHB21_05785, partial [Minicystis sp.]|nr:hypothetical protein [Minicystis sp.]
LAKAQQALAEKLTVVTPAHPDAISAAARVETAKQNLDAAEDALRAAKAGSAPSTASNADLDPAKRAALEKERTSLRAQIAQRRKQLQAGAPDAPPAKDAAKEASKDGDKSHAKSVDKKPAKQDVVDLETEWHRLKLELDHARDELHDVEMTAQAAEMSADAMQKKSKAEMQILEPAYLPTKPDRGKGRVFLAGAVISLFFALAYAATRVLLNDTLLDEGDVAALGGTPVLVALPALPGPARAPKQRPMVTRSAPEPVPARDEPEAADEPPAVVVTTPPPASEPPRSLPSHLPRRRVHQATIRFGTRIPVDGHVAALDAGAVAAVDPEPPPSRAALTIVPALPIVSIGAEPKRPPEVEVVGADVDGEGDGAFVLLRDATPAVLAALRVLRHRLDQRRAGGPLVVSVVSPGPGEGKTTLAARLAMTLSESDRARVVLVEGNLERPHVAAALGLALPDQVALSRQVHEHMLGRGRPWGVVKLGPSLAVLAEPGTQAAFPGVIHATQFQDALHALKRRYDYVVIDGPSVLGSGDANVLEEVSDGVILVARAASTRGTALSQAEAQLGDRRLLGVVL